MPDARGREANQTIRSRITENKHGQAIETDEGAAQEAARR